MRNDVWVKHADNADIQCNYFTARTLDQKYRSTVAFLATYTSEILSQATEFSSVDDLVGDRVYLLTPWCSAYTEVKHSWRVRWQEPLPLCRIMLPHWTITARNGWRNIMKTLQTPRFQSKWATMGWRTEQSADPPPHKTKRIHNQYHGAKYLRNKLGWLYSIALCRRKAW